MYLLLISNSLFFDRLDLLFDLVLLRALCFSLLFKHRLLDQFSPMLLSLSSKEHVISLRLDPVNFIHQISRLEPLLYLLEELKVFGRDLLSRYQILYSELYELVHIGFPLLKGLLSCKHRTAIFLSLNSP